MSKIRALIVDDSSVMRKIVERCLRQAGIELDNPGGLNSVGKNLFLATTASGDPVLGTPGGTDGLGQIEQGYLEQSNVSVVDEFIQMIVAQRSYEANSRVVTAADQMFQLINSMGK